MKKNWTCFGENTVNFESSRPERRKLKDLAFKAIRIQNQRPPAVIGCFGVAKKKNCDW